jgi:hypothetical protein
MPTSLRLNISEPCPENWQQMTHQEQGRFCGSCQKTVVDFTMMSNQEVLNYFLKANHNVCGRFSNDQLNKDLMVTEKKKRFSWAYVWNVMLATFLLTEASAQVKPKPKKPVKIMQRSALMGEVAYVHEEPPVKSVIPIVVKGKVLDAETNLPLAGASITIIGTGKSVISDTLGNFRLTVEKKDSLELEFSFTGKELQTRVLEELTNWQDVQVSLKPAFSNLAEVVVISYPKMGKVSFVMASMSCIKTVKVDTLSNSFFKNRGLTGRQNMKIYPNPVVRGNSVQVNVSLKKAGDYRLEVLNTTGQVMLVQPLFMQSKEQLVDVHTQTIWSAGIYWIRISSANTKNVYESKLLVQ